MTLYYEQARAKINLTLKVLGKRPDGYHELESLVAFADAGDPLILDTGRPVRLIVDGPFSEAIAGVNLLETLLATLRDRFTGLVLGEVRLTKNLPVAAGMGGGSSDAGALLRAIRKANPELANSVDWQGLALGLGADIPVCLANTPSWMLGRGEHLVPLATPLPRLFAVIANPLASVPPGKTAQVFRKLAAGPVPDARAASPVEVSFTSVAALVALIENTGNDLATPATEVVPAAGEVLSAMRSLAGALTCGLSGAGPTAFALFGSIELAETASREIASLYRSWWVRAVTIA